MRLLRGSYDLLNKGNYPVFLKTKGIDHSRHPVGEELKRVKAYFDKIKEAEDPATRESTTEFNLDVPFLIP